MYLANNSISRLPPELFRVNALTVLSLRESYSCLSTHADAQRSARAPTGSNDLTSIPPQIAQLKALQELNLAQNKLRWLPAEMLNMRLIKLTVSGNPWLSPPPLPPQRNLPTSEGAERRRPVSDTIARFVVPPLSEICLRILLAPSKPPSQTSRPPTHSAMPPPAATPTSSTPASSSRLPHAHTQSTPAQPPDPPARQLTILEARYALPLTEDDHYYSPALLQILRACVPAAVARPSEFERDGRTRARAKVRRADVGGDVHSSTRVSSSPRRARAPERGQQGEGDADRDEDVFAAPRVASLPTSASTSTSSEEEDACGVSACPSPFHSHPRGGGGGGPAPPSVYVRHAEERWTWEEVVAGVRVGAEGVHGDGDRVPVRWRGCARGCLGFLDPDPPLPPERAREPKAPISVQAQEGELEQEDGQAVAGVGEEQEPPEELELDLDIGGGGGVSVGMASDFDFSAGDVAMEDAW